MCFRKDNLDMQLTWHNYKYYPYEKDLALREIQSLLTPDLIEVSEKGVNVKHPVAPEMAQRLVYFAGYTNELGLPPVNTMQRILEQVNGSNTSRQATRYSAHGLHEYKGKFNPQVAKAILNIFAAKPGQTVLDPFCGSGTSLVECAHLGIDAIGTDINPLAVFIANAKLRSLQIPAERLLRDGISCLIDAEKYSCIHFVGDERDIYLQSWFPMDYLQQIEKLRIAIKQSGSASTNIMLVIASNLLRDYSLQEPHDLRIRRRKSPFPEKSFFQAYREALEAFCKKLSDFQRNVGVVEIKQRAINIDCKNAMGHDGLGANTFDLALTSPPYATALPYIDTQRLSLVWLGLLTPSEVKLLEAELVGSREIRGAGKKNLLAHLEKNEDGLPETEAHFCLQLQQALSETDGFRRQAVPRLLYRYFSAMSDVFASVRGVVKEDAPFGLIVGGNHTVLGGTRFDINTPQHLANLAVSRGWQHVETIPLQTYKRYGLHQNNATTTEALIVLKAAASN